MSNPSINLSIKIPKTFVNMPFNDLFAEAKTLSRRMIGSAFKFPGSVGKRKRTRTREREDAGRMGRGVKILEARVPRIFALYIRGGGEPTEMRPKISQVDEYVDGRGSFEHSQRSFLVRIETIFS